MRNFKIIKKMRYWKRNHMDEDEISVTSYYVNFSKQAAEVLNKKATYIYHSKKDKELLFVPTDDLICGFKISRNYGLRGCGIIKANNRSSLAFIPIGRYKGKKTRKGFLVKLRRKYEKRIKTL